MKQPREIMTADEVAAYLQVHRSTVYKMVQLPCFRVGAELHFLQVSMSGWRKGK